MAATQILVAADPTVGCDYALMLTIPGIRVVTAATMLAEVANIAELTKGAGSFRRSNSAPDPRSAGQRIAPMGSQRLRRALYMCSLSSKRHNPALSGFV